MHVAGHGAPGADGGVVLSGQDTYLGASEVRAMRIVPELVFLNCCHLAGRDAATVLVPGGVTLPPEFMEKLDSVTSAGQKAVPLGGVERTWVEEEDDEGDEERDIAEKIAVQGSAGWGQ